VKLLRFCLVTLIVTVGLSLAACCCPGGSKTKTVVVPAQTQSATPTLGKELEDLNAAYKKGAITKEEYEAARKKLVEQGGQQPK